MSVDYSVGGGLPKVSNRRNEIGANSYIGSERGAACAIINKTVFNDRIEAR